VHASGVYSRSAPGVFDTYFYNHASRPRLEELLHVELSMVFLADIFNHFWIQVQVAVSLLKSPHGGFKSKTAVA
jgi:hypothetical protein